MITLPAELRWISKNCGYIPDLQQEGWALQLPNGALPSTRQAGEGNGMYRGVPAFLSHNKATQKKEVEQGEVKMWWEE